VFTLILTILNKHNLIEQQYYENSIQSNVYEFVYSMFINDQCYLNG